jgi:hypothetical protein
MQGCTDSIRCNLGAGQYIIRLSHKLSKRGHGCRLERKLINYDLINCLHSVPKNNLLPNVQLFRVMQRSSHPNRELDGQRINSEKRKPYEPEFCVSSDAENAIDRGHAA